jgi:small-conductance mechanosensitive channel
VLYGNVLTQNTAPIISSLLFTLRAYINKSEQMGTETDMRINIFEAFKDNGVEIPFSQQDIHIKTMV